MQLKVISFYICGRQVKKIILVIFFSEEFRSVSLKYAHSTPVSNEDAIINAYYLVSRLTQQSRTSTKPDSAQHFSELVFSIRKLNTPAMEKLWQKVHQEEDEKMQ